MSRLAEFDINDTATPRATFKVGSTLTDPTTVTLTVTDPAGTATSYTYAAGTVDKDSTGVYSKDITPDSAGEWIAAWAGTGACSASGTVRFAVRRAGS